MFAVLPSFPSSPRPSAPSPRPIGLSNIRANHEEMARDRRRSVAIGCSVLQLLLVFISCLAPCFVFGLDPYGDTVTYIMTTGTMNLAFSTILFATVGLLEGKILDLKTAMVRCLGGSCFVGFPLTVVILYLFGAPLIRNLAPTIAVAHLLSSFVFVPAACLYGSRKAAWLELIRVKREHHTSSPLDVSVLLPFYLTFVFAWAGAWTIPLDWEQPWQVWPIPCAVGGVIGNALGIVASIVLNGVGSSW
eukprot:TRINITY_DN5706_c0_g1_i1.p1 TRINITY_DN5706_c0_g1~~TRINITY_DN5706_c0_g1_i1.p1  ORF type:complete len:247 (+),score=19.81 TRINITY_DN5706_c0_g1_i1:204-944(+)